jgi:hypothetical protein
MATKKSMWILFGILVISAWVLASFAQAGAETMKCRSVETQIKNEQIAVNDEPRHVLGMQITEGLAVFENGEIAKRRCRGIYDTIAEKGGQWIIYSIFTFEDGSTIVLKFQRLRVTDQGGNLTTTDTSDLIKGTGRFEGIKGTISATGKTFPGSEGDAAKFISDITFTYTLPPK